MSNNSYFVEFAKSGRSKCKKCKNAIVKDELRIVVEIPGESFTTTQSFHPRCFSLPRKLTIGATKIDVPEFIDTYLEDKTGGNILPSKFSELCTAIESKKAPSSSTKQQQQQDGDHDNDNNNNDYSMIAKLKEAYQVMEFAKENQEKEPPMKKLKGSSDKSNNDIVDDKTFQKQVELYGKYHKMKNDDVKDILGYNRQTKTGTKDFLLMKLIDGISYGRLARCQLCDGGRLKVLDDGNNNTIVCMGTFDEATNTRIPCQFTCPPAKAPRYQPWYMEEPTEEEKEEMDRLEAEAKGEEPSSSSKSAGAGGGTSSDTSIQQFIALAKDMPWDLSNRDGLRAAAKDMISLLSGSGAKTNNNNNSMKKVDLPADPSQAMQKVGQMIATNRDKTVSEMIPMIVKQFGYIEDKIVKETKKKESMKHAVACTANASLVSAFQELAELYFKTGNANAGSVYMKVVKALADLPYEITEQNAKGLAKGKTKVNNIGKSSADKIYEFCKTGTIEKLEEKRADAA